MTTQEMNEIWRLIGVYRQGDQRFQDKGLLKAWYAALRVYDVDAVKNAVVEHFRSSSFFPDVSEIVARLPRKTERDRRGCDDADTTDQTSLNAWQREWHEELHTLGLPTFHEAIAAGMSLARWRAMLSEAGVWT